MPERSTPQFPKIGFLAGVTAAAAWAGLDAVSMAMLPNAVAASSTLKIATLVFMETSSLSSGMQTIGRLSFKPSNQSCVSPSFYANSPLRKRERSVLRKRAEWEWLLVPRAGDEAKQLLQVVNGPQAHHLQLVIGTAGQRNSDVV